MTSRRTSARRLSGWTALLAALALLAQGLWPAAAMPMPAGDGFQVQMCTPQGLQNHADPSAPTQDRHDCCDLCVMAAAAAPAAASPVMSPVRYVSAAEPFLGQASRPAPRARGPPRPPSQGPPRTV